MKRWFKAGFRIRAGEASEFEQLGKLFDHSPDQKNRGRNWICYEVAVEVPWSCEFSEATSGKCFGSAPFPSPSLCPPSFPRTPAPPHPPAFSRAPAAPPPLVLLSPLARPSPL